MNFLPMRYYLEVVREKSISRAAERLHVTQQTLSAHIAALERELGCPLFERRPRLTLTYAGRVFADYARRFGQLYRSMEQEFDDIARRESGELVIGVAPTRGRFLLAPVLAAYRKAHPGIRLRLIETTNEGLIAGLLAGETDLIFANLTGDDPLISSRRFYEEEMVLLVPSSLLSPGERRRVMAGDYQPLAGCPFLMNRLEDIAGRLGGAFLERHGLLPRIAVTSENLETLLDLCLAGEGACFCPKELAEKAFAGRDASHLLEISLEARFSIRAAWLNRPYIPRAITDFVALCAGDDEETPPREGGKKRPGSPARSGRRSAPPKGDP